MIGTLLIRCPDCHHLSYDPRVQVCDSEECL